MTVEEMRALSLSHLNDGKETNESRDAPGSGAFVNNCMLTGTILMCAAEICERQDATNERLDRLLAGEAPDGG